MCVFSRIWLFRCGRRCQRQYLLQQEDTMNIKFKTEKNHWRFRGRIAGRNRYTYFTGAAKKGIQISQVRGDGKWEKEHAIASSRPNGDHDYHRHLSSRRHRNRKDNLKAATDGKNLSGPPVQDFARWRARRALNRWPGLSNPFPWPAARAAIRGFRKNLRKQGFQGQKTVWRCINCVYPRGYGSRKIAWLRAPQAYFELLAENW